MDFSCFGAQRYRKNNLMEQLFLRLNNSKLII